MTFSSSAAEHALHLKAVFSEVREHKVLIKASKCVWVQTEMPYLGHVIGKDGVKPDPKKVQSVVDWPTPTCLREVQQFLGLTNFFIKYIQGYAHLTKPLTDLSKKIYSLNGLNLATLHSRHPSMHSLLLLFWHCRILASRLSLCVMFQALVLVLFCCSKTDLLLTIPGR